MSNMPEEKEITIPAWVKTQSSGGYSRHLKWVWTSGFETYVSTILVSLKNKNKKIYKTQNKNETSLRRGTRRTRPKYGQSALHLSSGSEIDKHRVECTKPSTKLGSPYLGRLREVRILTRDSGCNICFLSILYTVPFDFGDPTCPLTAVKCLFLKLKKKIALSKWLVLIDFHIELKSPKLLLYSIWMRRGKLSYIQVTLFLLLFIRFAVIFISFPCSL